MSEAVLITRVVKSKSKGFISAERGSLYPTYDCSRFDRSSRGESMLWSPESPFVSRTRRTRTAPDSQNRRTLLIFGYLFESSGNPSKRVSPYNNVLRMRPKQASDDRTNRTLSGWPTATGLRISILLIARLDHKLSQASIKQLVTGF